MNFDSKTGYITVTIGDRNQKFRLEPRDGYSLVVHSEDSRPWCPPRTATMEEEVMYTALRNMHDTVTRNPTGTATPTECDQLRAKVAELERAINPPIPWREIELEQPPKGTP